MEYVIPIVLVMLIVGGFVTFLVLNATKKSKPSEAQASEDKAPTNMAAADEDSPLGDTSEHAGEQSEQGHTVRDPEGGGEGEPDGGAPVRPGEGEGGETAPQPESEKLANRRMV
jgi:hypothetical protein